MTSTEDHTLIDMGIFRTYMSHTNISFDIETPTASFLLQESASVNNCHDTLSRLSTSVTLLILMITSYSAKSQVLTFTKRLQCSLLLLLLLPPPLLLLWLLVLLLLLLLVPPLPSLLQTNIHKMQHYRNIDERNKYKKYIKCNTTDR